MNVVTAPPRPRFTRGWVVLLWALALGVYFFVPVSSVLDTSLDASNYASYTRFAAEQRQFGTEVVPMAGPFGFVLYGWVYGGDLYGLRLVLEFATKLVLGIFVLWFFRRAGAGVARWFWLAANLLVLPTTGELSYDVAVLYAALFLLVERPRWIGALLTVTFLAFLAMCKGTQLIFTMAVLAVVGGAAAWRRAWVDLAILIGGFVGALLLFWCIAGQNLANLPAYIRNIQELSTGYVSGMALQESARTFGVGLASIAITLASLALLVYPHRRNPTIIAGAAVLMGFAFLEWKHGFVRADGHVFLFFHYCILGGVTLLLLDRVTGSPVRTFGLRAGLALLGTVFALYGTGEEIGVRFAGYGRALVRNVPASLPQLLRPAAERQRLEAVLTENRARFALPETTERVGRSSIGFFGYQSGYLALNRLNERPSPVAGGGPFSVFTPHLQQINERHLLNPSSRPDYYLLKLQTIDDRFIPQDDASSLNALLRLYRPILAERGMLLLQLDPSAPAATAPRLLGRVPLRPGQTIDVPAVGDDEMLLAAFELPASGSGQLRAALYKSAIVSLTFTVDGVPTPMTRRIIPSMASAAFLLSPIIERTEDLLTLYKTGEGRRMRTLQVTAAPSSGLDVADCAVTFFAQRRPSPLTAEVLSTLGEQFSYPPGNRAPQLVEASNARVKEIDGRTVQLLEPPGRMLFNLVGDERELRFDYGFDPEAYTRGTTDGADFIVELLSPEGKAEQLFLSRREPRTTPADRGRHHAQLWLPVFKPGMQLQLRTGGGLRGAADWDWTFYDNLQLHRGPLRVEQFPGFSVAPDAVEGAEPRMIEHEGHHALLLNAPGKLEFALDGTEQALHFTGGLMPGAYTEGNTDGAEFIVELQRANQPSEVLFRRWLQPKTVAADRGAQTFDVPLSAAGPGARLTLRTTAGPHDDPSWDWTYVGEIRLQRATK